jgi:hypothetical protein
MAPAAGFLACSRRGVTQFDQCDGDRCIADQSSIGG